jgi:hypothetical protein
MLALAQFAGSQYMVWLVLLGAGIVVGFVAYALRGPKQE